ncbi:MAG: hydrogenase formation protein HypD [Nitrospirae bacterium]|nr:hydrogenase formation protein HypD [Nitrospirota bacterium]
MKYLDEFRDSARTLDWIETLRGHVTRPWMLMEICGGQTHGILRSGIDTLLPKEITLVHGPGCPVCVTPPELLDKAMALEEDPSVILCTFGDMMRVPGYQKDLLSVKALGGDVRMVYSPLDVLGIASRNPDKEIVFFAVGFETTAPATAMAVFQADRMNLQNLSFLVAHVRVPPAMELILSSPENRIQGFLAPGHVCTVMGTHEYEILCERYNVPIVVTGFEPTDLLQGIDACIRQLEEGRAELENRYPRVVRTEGNLEALSLMEEIFQVEDRAWRGIGMIPNSGMGLRSPYERFNAEKKFSLSRESTSENENCIAGMILMGKKPPSACPSFRGRCTPDHPLGAPMVSSEGACAAYFRYHDP